MSDHAISVDDPRAEDMRALLARHFSFASSQTPPEDTHALDLDRLLDPRVTYFTCRADGVLIAFAELKELNPHHGELKSMHTSECARGRGIGRAMLAHLISVARERGYRRISLETGSMAAFVPARSLYASAGFDVCRPFGGYLESPNSTYMMLSLDNSHADAPSGGA